MKKNIKIIFWTVFTLGVVFFYFIVRNNPNNDHLRVIPVQADNVVVLNLNELILSYKELIEEDPSKLDSLFTDIFKPTEDSDFEPPAVTPFQKIAIYSLTDDVRNFDLLLICLNATSVDGLINMMNKYDEEPVFIEQEGGIIGWLKKSNVAFLKNNTTVVMVSPLTMKLSDDELDKELLQNQYKNHFSKGDKLADVSEEFANIIASKSHIDYYKSSGSNLVDKIEGQVLQFTSENFIRENHLQMFLKDEGVLFSTFMTFASDNVIQVQEDNTPLELIGLESFKFSTSLNPFMMTDVINDLIPTKYHNLIKPWTGRMCFAVHGYDNISLKTIRQPILEEGTIIKSTKADTIPLNASEFLSYPMFQLACELNKSDVPQVLDMINSTPEFKKEGELYYYEVPEILIERIDKSTKDTSYLVQRVYFYIQDNHLIFSPTSEINSSFKPEYRTFSLAFSFDNLVASYKPRNKIDFFAMSFIPTFELDAFTMNYKSISGNKLELNGVFTIKNPDVSHLLKLPLLFLKLSDIDFTEVIKAI